MTKLLLYPEVEEPRLSLIRRAAGDLPVVNVEQESQAVQEIRDATGFFGKITPPLLEAAEKLEWIQSPTASLEHYLFPELIAHPCRLSNMRGLFSDVIADHVLGFIICFARNFHLYFRQQQQGEWAPIGGREQAPIPFGRGPADVTGVDRAHRHLADCTLGIVGTGAIGSEIGRRANGFGMRIVGVDPVAKEIPGVLNEVGSPGQLPELLGESDFVVIAAPHTPQTERMFGSEQFEQMRDDAVLINIGRGAIVDLEALTTALREQRIGGAALDVFETEPLPSDHPLWRMPNAILTPHIAAASPRIAGRHLETLLENVRRFSRGEPPRNLVDKSRWF